MNDPFINIKGHCTYLIKAIREKPHVSEIVDAYSKGYIMALEGIMRHIKFEEEELKNQSTDNK